jgi:hypothetical protein
MYLVRFSEICYWEWIGKGANGMRMLTLLYITSTLRFPISVPFSTTFSIAHKRGIFYQKQKPPFGYFGIQRAVMSYSNAVWVSPLSSGLSSAPAAGIFLTR